MSLSYRFEVKIPIPLNRYEIVKVWLNNHGLLFQTHHPQRWVNSLYLDLQNLASFEENLSGISQRKKIRIRWYHQLDNAEKAVLEFKHRQAGVQSINRELLLLERPGISLTNRRRSLGGLFGRWISRCCFTGHRFLSRGFSGCRFFCRCFFRGESLFIFRAF